MRASLRDVETEFIDEGKLIGRRALNLWFYWLDSVFACNTLERSVRRLPTRGSGRVIPGDAALHAFDRLTVTVLGDGAPGDFPLAGEFINRQTDLFDRKLG